MRKAKLISCAAIFATTTSQAQAEDFKYRPWMPEYLEYVACIYDKSGFYYELSQAECKPVKERLISQLKKRSTMLNIKEYFRAEKYLEYNLKWMDKRPKPGSLDTMFEGFEHLTAGYLRCAADIIVKDADFKVGHKINTKLATKLCKAEFSAVADSMQDAKLRRRARNDVSAWRDWIESSGIEYGQFGDGTLARPDEPAGPATYTGEP